MAAEAAMRVEPRALIEGQRAHCWSEEHPPADRLIPRWMGPWREGRAAYILAAIDAAEHNRLEHG